MNGAQMDRVSDQDKAVMDIKARQRMIRTYQEKMTNQEKDIVSKIKDLLKDGQKQRALIQLKQKKFMEKEIQKAEGAQAKLQECLMNIESTAADVEIFNALKQGDQVLKDLQE